jgi:hypothetical protein
MNGHAPKSHTHDNERSDALKQAFKKHNVDFQRAPLHSHHRNAAGGAIQTWKRRKQKRERGERKRERKKTKTGWKERGVAEVNAALFN